MSALPPKTSLTIAAQSPRGAEASTRSTILRRLSKIIAGIQRLQVTRPTTVASLHLRMTWRVDFSKSESFYNPPAYWPSSIQNLVQLAKLSAVVTPRKGAYAALPLNCRSRQPNNALVVNNDSANPNIATFEQRRYFSFQCHRGSPPPGLARE